jgi:hypothetical protein
MIYLWASFREDNGTGMDDNTERLPELPYDREIPLSQQC